jgi:hypothetical protein
VSAAKKKRKVSEPAAGVPAAKQGATPKGSPAAVKRPAANVEPWQDPFAVRGAETKKASAKKASAKKASEKIAPDKKAKAPAKKDPLVDDLGDKEPKKTKPPKTKPLYDDL